MIRPLQTDLSNLHNVNIEVKQLQVEHSINTITFPFLSYNTDEDFVQEEINASLNQALEEEHNKNQKDNFTIPYKRAQTLTKVGFPQNTWEKYKKGQRPSYDAQNKNQVHLEYNARLRPDILKVFKQWKHLIRNKLGRKTFPFLGVPKGAKKTKLQAYIELCTIHVAAM